MANYSGTVVCASCKKITPRDYSKCQVCGAPLLVFENTDPHKTAGQIEADALGASAEVAAARTLVAPRAAEQTKPVKTSTEKNATIGCLGCLGVIVLLIIGMIFVPHHQDSDSYQAGHKVGFMDGNMAMMQGRVRASDSDKEAAAWSVASRFTSDTQQQKQDWVNGYKAGWDDGYASH